MKIRLEIDSKYSEPEIRVCDQKDNPKIRNVCQRITELLGTRLMAYDDGDPVPVPASDIIRIYSQNKLVFLTTSQKTYRIKERLYEVETLLDPSDFVRISNSEIINIHKLMRMDTSLTGTIRMMLAGDIETYVSRRYVSKIKSALGI